MKLTRNGTLARLYEWTYERSVPRDLCTFFWGLLFAVLFFPITWTTYPFKFPEAGVVGRVFVGIGLWGGLSLIAFATVQAYINVDGFLRVMEAVGIIVGAIVGLVLLIAGVGYFFIESQTWEEVKSVVGERKQSFKEKYCPRIDWI